MGDKKDVAWKYSRAVKEGSSVALRCNLCGKVTKGGVFRMKEHLVGGKRNATKCPNATEEVRKEVLDFMNAKKQSKEVVDLNEFEVEDYDEDDDVLMQPHGPQPSVCGSTTSTLHKTQKMKGPMDVYFTPDPEVVVMKRKGRQPKIDENDGAKKRVKEKSLPRNNTG
ncbi:hypothetical protein OROMI_007843 [Orobanche minor]